MKCLKVKPNPLAPFRRMTMLRGDFVLSTMEGWSATELEEDAGPMELSRLEVDDDPPPPAPAPPPPEPEVD